MRNQRGNLYVSILLGVLLASLLGLTTDEIIKNVYDSSNTALRVNLVAGGSGGTVTGTGTANVLTKWTSATAIGNFAVTDDSVPVGNGTTTDAKVLTTCTGAGKAVTYDASTNAFGCNTISAGAAGSDTQVQFNDGGTALGGDAGFTYNKTTDSATLVGNIGAATALITGRATFGSAVDAANAVDINETAGSITFEGSTLDAFETRLTPANPAADAVITLPNATTTLPGLALTNTWAGTNNFGVTNFADNARVSLGGSAQMGGIQGTTVTTPDTFAINTQSLSNAVEISEIGDQAYDFNNGPCGTSACTDPTLIVHSHNQTTTEWVSLAHNGTNAVISTGTGSIDHPNGLISTNTGSIGWSVVTGANTACNTTCTNACVVGFATGTVGSDTERPVACTDASADRCLCAGSS